MRAKRWIGLAVAGVAAASLVGCGSPAPAVIGPVSPEGQHFFAQYASVRARLTGSPEAIAQARQQVLADCLATKGLTYRGGMTVPIHQQPGYEPAWWAAPDPAVVALGMGYARASLEEPTTMDIRYDGMTDAQQSSYRAALSTCTTVLAYRFQDDVSSEATKLMSALDDELFLAARRPAFAPVAARYAACMHEAGVDVSAPGELYDLAETQVYAADAGADGVQVEVAVGSADAACRAKDATAVAELLGPVLTTWLATHTHEIDAAAASLTDPTLPG